MKKYEKYKNSGVEWLGEIPEHWKLAPIKHLFSFTTGFTPPTNRSDYYDGEIDWVTIADMNEKFISKSKSKITNKAIQELAKEPVLKGSLLYSFKLSVGKVGFAAKELFTNEAIFSIFPREGLALSYYYYALPEILIHNANENIYGAKLLNQELILNSLMLSLPLIEQKTIAQYLDFTIDKIEQLISEKSSLITKLQEKRKALINEVVTKGLNPNAPMRDSGIEWLGMVPEHWGINRVKSIVSLINEKNAKSSSKKVGLENIESKTGKFLESNSVFEGEGIEFGVDDILFGKLRPYLAKVYLSEFCGQAVGDFYVLRSRNCVLPKYLSTLLISDLFISIVDGSTYGAKMPRANWEFISNIQVAIPSTEEQSAIVDFIESRTTKIDEIVSETQLQIQKLKEYKTSVISEVVTGKVDVREWKPRSG